MMPQDQGIGLEVGAGFLSLLPCCVIGLIVPAMLILWIWALIDCARSDFKDNDKLVWILVILLANWIGAIVYFLFARKLPKDHGSRQN